MEEILELLTKHPEIAKSMITGMTEQYKPLVYAVANEVFKVYKDLANNKELAEAKATSRKNQYDAYVTVGFTEDEAMGLLLTDIRQTAEFVEKGSYGINKVKSNKTTL